MSKIMESEKLTVKIIALLSGSEGLEWEELANQVATSCKCSNFTRIHTIITSMIASEKLTTNEAFGGKKLLKLAAAEKVETTKDTNTTTTQHTATHKGKFGLDWTNEWMGTTQTTQNEGGRVEKTDKTKQIEIEMLKDTIKSQNSKLKIAEEMYQHAKKGLESSLDAMKIELEETKKVKVPGDKILKVQVVKGQKVQATIEGVFHEKFERVLQLAQARRNIFIYGPTGCGKTHICEQLAKALDLSFAFTSCTNGMSEGILTGMLLPFGKGGAFEYLPSEFIKAYEEGGVYLIDEMDAADPNVLLVVNSALANGIINLPKRRDVPYVKRHPDFVCIGAANTVGTGGDRLYNGRNKLDMSTLDRFAIGKVLMDYDPVIELALCPDDELRAKFLKYRKAIMAHRLERAMSTRFLADAYLMKTQFSWSIEAIEEGFFQGWRHDEVAKVKNYL